MSGSGRMRVIHIDAWGVVGMRPSGLPTTLLNHICFSNVADKEPAIGVSKDKVRMWTHVIGIKCQVLLLITGHPRAHGRPDT